MMMPVTTTTCTRQRQSFVSRRGRTVAFPATTDCLLFAVLLLPFVVVRFGLCSSATASAAPAATAFLPHYVAARPSKHCWASFTHGGKASLSVASDSSTFVGGSDNVEWMDLTEDRGVRKYILQEGSGESIVSLGKEEKRVVEITYVGTFGPVDWSADEVIDCWLSSQQGLEKLSDGFRKADITAHKLMDETVFTEEFVANTLGVTNRIQLKKVLMATKRLAKTRQDFPVGTLFDSNDTGFSFEIGGSKRKVIRGMEVAVLSMNVGETARVISRADYAYGKDGYRKANGDVMIPEYATLQFDITLLSYSPSPP